MEQVLRDLSTHETIFCAVRQIEGTSSHGNIISKIHLESDSDKSLSVLNLPTLRRAVHILRKRHPLLDAKVVQKWNWLVPFSTKYQYVTTKTPVSISLRDLPQNDPEGDTIVSELLNMDLHKIEPHWMVVLLQTPSQDKQILLISVAHVIADLQAATTISTELLDLCDNHHVNDGENLDQLSSYPTEPVPQSLYELTSPELKSWGSVFTGLQVMKNLTNELRGGQGLQVTRESVEGPRENWRVLHSNVTFSKDDTRRLAQMSKNHATTVHGALCAATCYTVHQQNEKIDRYVITSSLDMRRHFDPPLDSKIIATFAGAVSQVSPIIDDHWELAKKLRDDLMRDVSGGDVLRMNSVTEMMTPFLFKVAFRSISYQTSGVPLVANVGRVNIPGLRRIGVKWEKGMSMIFSSPILAASVYLTVCTCNDVLSVTGTATAPMYTQERLDLFMSSFQQKLALFI
eukprot:TRINITY_DN1161_c0_g3_i1.p1 TRINITY_DN1161_c0_g3~~TRINITY_DN1161_c0_g3_i1.p1  ORF type:complete len:458 (-),score=60.87 TRINITY_DN1161_c0_g3_i1:69-1442(-)